MISSPIPVDPGYGKNGRGQSSSLSMVDTRPVPRVRPEAEVIATRAQGSVGLLLQVQGQPIYRAPVTRKPEPKNFSQENVRRMRKIQAMSRKKRTEETIAKNQPVKVLPQSEKYREVQSRVAAHIQQVPPTPRPASANYLRSYSRSGSAPPRVRSPSPAPRERAQSQAAQYKNEDLEVRGRSRSPAPQRRPATAGQVGQRARSPSPGPRPRTSSGSSDINFIAHNARLARKHQPQRPPSVVAQVTLDERRKADMDKYNKGTVPKYLRNRQHQWQEEEAERIRNIPDPEMPPGHKMMSKEERIKTLNILKEKEKELQQQLHKVPLNPETLRAKTLKTDIETKLAEVEEAIKIFSRNKVFIKVDS